MTKTYSMLLILALGAPAAAELAAPQLPFIDAAVVRAQPFEKETINIGAAFPGMQTCGFTAAQGKLCVFTCKDGSTVNRPALASSLVPNGCAKFIMVPSAKTQNKGAVTAADRVSAREIAALAAAANSPFGSLDGGNLGLSAYRLSPEAANLAIKLVKEIYPGMQAVTTAYSAFGPRLIFVITSDDEPYVHMYNQDPASGRLTPAGDFNSADAGGPYKNAALNSALPYNQNVDPLVTLLTGLAGPGRGTPLPLGQGSASAWWWMN
ncbi:MAG: hypothetical protein A2X35_07230 [Elusimicrobia bacterium GWA2_61_42]|nr:MAG: hypothetical protein A2X35_07230 [Elusimicrobia bacterium GWA2_61_42]OGR75004.1 MAG: hypothetical protein A2X38_01380 [Elusimicrobia bacterium GWC2_61_25]